MFDYKKKKQIENLFAEFRLEVVNSVVALKRAILTVIDPLTANIDETISLVRISEAKADTIRGELEVLLYGKSLFPESRGDIIGLVEATDKVANHAESVALMLKTHNINSFPDFCISSILAIVNYGVNITQTLCDAEAHLFKNYHLALPLIGQISQIESDADDVEIFLVEKIFKSDIDSYKKIILSEWIRILSRICDKAEDASDIIRVIVAKRGL
ncbi:MAG: DUF47 domain-containing protein [Bdellovibrionota bacterium]